jgi:hypothetical protein
MGSPYGTKSRFLHPLLVWGAWLFPLLLAQEMPDSIWGLVGSDTVSLTVHEGFPGGWSIRLFYKVPPWQEVSRETLQIDTTPRLLQWTQYCQPPFEKPCRRVTGTYLAGRFYYTVYQYQEPIFTPFLRLYVWGGLSPATENLLFSVAAQVIWPTDPDTLHPVWPFPRFWRRSHWPDSTLTETFDSTYQVFIETAALKRAPATPSCDSTRLYEGAILFPVGVGEGVLCFPDGERLSLARDSLCDNNSCWITQRTLAYAGGLPIGDTLRLTQRTRLGQTLASQQLLIRYQYDSNGRLIEIITPTRRYRLSYSGKILALSYPISAPPFVQYSSTARWVQLQNLTHPATLSLYDLLGNRLFTAEAPADGWYFLPSHLTGTYLLGVVSGSSFSWQKLILLP